MNVTPCDPTGSPLISVIIPVYNTQKYLSRCINSLLNQTYKQLEIILVDDCSTDGSDKIIVEYINSDDRIKTVKHEKNKGLFQARISGASHATGKYLAFVDSDDYISIDWFRMLLRQAESTNSDIVVGEWSYDTDGKHRDYVNLDHFRLMDYHLENEQIMDTFMKIQGRNFSWTVVWNKLYTKELWDKCAPLFNDFSSSHGHMLMWEDIAFSSALFAYAKRVTNVHGINYFYFKHSEASTALNTNKSRNLKYIHDASSAMKFVKRILLERELYQQYEQDYLAWNKYGMNIVYKDLVTNLHNKNYKQQILSSFNCTEDDYEEISDFFHSITTPLTNTFEWYEDAKKKISSETTKYVSFDIFDTLIQRPFLYPTDLFEILSESFNKNLSAYVNFKVIREQAEKTVRQQLVLYNPSREEITLDEIYQYIKNNYEFDDTLIDNIKQYEIELELRYCTQRKTGKELFDLALDCGKKIIICSDMYLPADAIFKILTNNGYDGYNKLYLSSEVKLTKDRKSLYKYVQKDLGCKNANEFMHIGDNYYSDIENSSACGWRNAHLPKASEIMFNSNSGIYGGEAFDKIYRKSYFKEDYCLAFNDFTAIRSMLSLIANKVFDNPYISVNPWSDFNANPKMIGYAALGPHLLALCNWINKVAVKENIGTIHFVARDGYIVKQAFDLCNHTKIKTNYIRLSRKALVLADVNTIADLYSIFNKMNCIVPKKLAEYLRPIIPVEKIDKIPQILAENDINYHRPLNSMVEYARCMRVFINSIIDMDMLPAYRAKLHSYFSEFVMPGDYIFDIGYSGRPESSLSNILGFPVGSLYIHTNSQIAAIRQEKCNCPTNVFYQFKPAITGVMREHLLMELGPSTVGYHEVEGKLVPLLEPYESEYWSEFVTNIIQDNALQFIKDYITYFDNFKIMFNFQNEVMSAPLEYYLHYSKSIDRQIFATLPFEDDLGEGKKLMALDFWNNELLSRNLGNIGNNISSSMITGDVIPGLYVDGYLMKFIQFVNKVFPRGGKLRKLAKKIASIFIH